MKAYTLLFVNLFLKTYPGPLLNRYLRRCITDFTIGLNTYYIQTELYSPLNIPITFQIWQYLIHLIRHSII